MVEVREEILTDDSKVYDCVLVNGDRKLVLACGDKSDAENICNELNNILESTRVVYISIQ